MSNDTENDRLMQVAAKLAKEVSPPRDLWPGIAEAIERPVPRRMTPWYAQAAAILLLVGGSSGMTWWLMQDDSTAGPQVVTPEMVFEQTSFGNRYHLGPGFTDARDSLVAELQIELAKLSVEDRATIQTNLAMIHDAIYDMNQALEQDPDNVLLQERLLKTYREELAMLRRVGGLTRNVMLRNDI